MCLQVSNAQQPMSDTELRHLRSALAAFLSKSRMPAVASDSTPDDVPAAAPTRASASPSPKASDKSAAVKKGKVGTEPAALPLSTCEGQMAEFAKWNSMLSSTSGCAAQDADSADWLASLLRLVVGQPVAISAYSAAL